ncbi:MAG: OmpA family protein [Rhodothermaceae bacterium]|nr:OmpA family protein [Rhodothermaceae bacterium]
MLRPLAVLSLVFLLAACSSDAPDESTPDAPQTTSTASTDVPLVAHEAEPLVSADSSEAERDLLTLANGATLVTASSEENRALDLINGNRADRAWANSGPRDAAPYTFVFELLAPTRLTQVGVNNAADQPSPSVTTARSFDVEASAEGPDAGFVPLGTLTVDEAEETLLDVASETPAQWLRFTLRDGQDADAGFIYFDEVVAYGEQEAVPSDDGRFTGIYETPGRSYVELTQDGAMLTGCYTGTGGRGGGTLFGHVEGGVARVSWVDRDTEGVNGTALFVIDSTGELVGVRYRLPGRNLWAGPRADDTVTTPCSEVEASGNPIGAALESAGEVTLYGIYFDFDRDTLKPTSEPVLQQLREALEASPALSVDIEGHTDDVGSEDYNEDLSQRRAAAVVAWLVEHGINEERLGPVGKGEAEPVADNATADGRALNRRVEVVRR